MRSKRPLLLEPVEGRVLLSGWIDTVTTDQSSYELGQPIDFTFTRTNISNEPVSFPIDYSELGFEVTQGGQPVQTSGPTVELPLGTIIELQPGQSWSTSGTWDGLSYSSDVSVATTTGSFVVTNQLDPSVSANFQIQSSPLTYSLSVPTSALPIPFGQAIDFSYTITNTSDQPVTFNLRPGDFLVAGEYDNLGTAWESDPGAASQPLTTETLQPGQSLTETASWNGMANEGSWAGADVFGDFTVSILGAPTSLVSDFLITDPLSGGVTWVPANTDPAGDVTYRLTATETNTSDQPETILNQNDTFVLVGSTTVTIPASSPPPAGPLVTLQPGQSQTFTATWDPDANPDSPAPAGTYTVSFQDTFHGYWGQSIIIASPDPTHGSPAPQPPPSGSPSPDPSGAPSSSTPACPTSPTSSAPAGSPLAATLSASPTTSQADGPVRIALTIENVSHEKVRLAPFAGRAEITLLRGSTVVATARKRLSVPQAATLRPARSLHLTTELDIRWSRAAVPKLGPGTYTLEVEEGGYSATTSIEIGRS
jgi:hypothetical protein